MPAPGCNATNTICSIVLAATWIGCLDQSETNDYPISGTAILFEGETMSFPAGTGGIQSDGAASGGSALELWSNATATKSASFSSSTTGLVIRARGDQCRGAPQMVVSVDGVQILSTYVSATSWTDYTATASLPSGTHAVSIAFTNDDYRRRCDRNLYIDKVSVLSDSANYTLSVSKQGSGTGMVTSSPLGIDCGATCSASFAAGTAVTLTAVGVSGSTFAGWSGACTGTGTCTVTMNSANAVVATFDASPAGACTPTGCAAQGKNCGTIADNCGATLECGGCPTNQVCDWGGNLNVCGSGSGTVYYASPSDNLNTKLAVLRPGDTLILNDGTYRTLRIDPGNGTGLNGTASAPITIQAAHDGKVIFDGGGTTQPIFVSGSSYVTLQGFVARNSVDNVVFIFGNNAGVLGGADHITLRRITAYDAADGNNHVFNISFGATNILVEDCAAWGRGRYRFIAYHADRVTFRRVWAYWEGFTSFSPAPRAPFAIYGASNVTLENVIGTNAIPTRSDDNYYTAVWHTSDDTTNWPSSNARIVGSMFYNNCEGYWENNSAGINPYFKDNYFDIPVNSTCPLYSTRPYGDGLVWNYSSSTSSILNAVFVNNRVGINRFGGIGNPGAINSVFVNNSTAIVSDPGHSYCSFYGNNSLGTSLASTDITANPGYDTATYGRGAYLFIPSASPLRRAGQSGADIGAHLQYRYVGGVLTNTALWPWPMESRVFAERGISVTWNANGGMWKTLSGVYP